MLNSLSWYLLLGNLHAWDSQELRFKVWATDVSLAFERLFFQIKTFSLKFFFSLHLLQNSLHIIQLFQTASRFLMRSWLSATTYRTFLKLDVFFYILFPNFLFFIFCSWLWYMLMNSCLGWICARTAQHPVSIVIFQEI